MEAPPNISPKKERDEIFKKANEKNENYTLNIKLKDNNSIYISATFEEENKLYEDTKSYEEIKKQQIYFDEYTIEEIYEEYCEDLSSKINLVNKGDTLIKNYLNNRNNTNFDTDNLFIQKSKTQESMSSINKSKTLKK